MALHELDNPHLSREALDEITGDLTDEAYRQEIMAEFLEGEGIGFSKHRGEPDSTDRSEPADHQRAQDGDGRRLGHEEATRSERGMH